MYVSEKKWKQQQKKRRNKVSIREQFGEKGCKEDWEKERNTWVNKRGLEGNLSK